MNVRVATCRASEQEWHACSDHIAAKVLSVDESRYQVEVLVKVSAGYRSERHRHVCETYAYFLDGKVLNETTGVTFGPGDFCYQPLNDEHVEHFIEETIAYVSYRGHQDRLVEFYDEHGEVCGQLSIADFAAMMP